MELIDGGCPRTAMPDPRAHLVRSTKTAGGDDRIARQPGGVVRCQKCRYCRDVSRLAGPAKRSLADRAFFEIGTDKSRRVCPLGLDYAGVYRVYADVSRP